MVRKLSLATLCILAIFLAGCEQYGGAVFPGGTTTTGPGLILTTQQCPPGYSYSGGIEVFDAWAANTLSPATPSDYTLLGFATNPGGRGIVNLCVPAGTSPLQIGIASTCPTNYANLGFVSVLQPGSANLQNLYFCTQTTANPLIRLVELPRNDPNAAMANWLMYEQNDPKCSAGTKPVGIISNGGYWTAEGKSAGKTYVKICAIPATITVAAPTPTAPTAPTAPTGPAVSPQPPGIPIPGIRPTAPTAPTGPVSPAPTQAPYVPTAPVSPTMPAGIPMPSIPAIKPTAPTGTCIDSDGGRDYLIKGTITIVGQPGKFLTDMCQIQTGPSSYVSTPSCSAGSTCFLEEAWCDAPSKTYRLFPAEYYQCPYGCNDGACLSAPAPTAPPAIIIAGDDCGKTAAEKCPQGFIEQGKIHVGVPANCGKEKIAGVSTSGKIIESGWLALCVQGVAPTITPTPAAPGCVQPPSGLVGWWTGDGNANDATGKNHGTLKEGATFTAGKVGQAFKLDGTNDHVNIGGASALSFGRAKPFTIDAWVQPRSGGKGGVVVSKFNRHVRGEYILRVNPDGTVVFHREISPYLLTTKDKIPFGQYSHIAVSYDQATYLKKIYINGVLNVFRLEHEQRTDTTTPVLIGAWHFKDAPADFFDGMIDEVEIFNRALTESEVKAIYNAGSAGKCKPGGST